MALDTDNALTTLDDVKTWCGVNTTDYDTLLTDLINSVSWQFNSFTNRKLKARDITAQYDGDGTNTMVLPEYPVNSITSIHVDTDREFTDDTKVTDFVFHENGLVTLDTNYFSKIVKANKIVYNAGYSIIPYDLQVACKDQIKWLFRRHRNNQEGVQSESTLNGSTTITEAGEILTTSLEILKRYRKGDHE